LIVIEKANRNYSAYSPDLPGCVATGKTREQATRQMYKAIELHVRGLVEDKQPTPKSSSFAEYVAVPDYNCIKIPDNISYEDGTSLIALATVFRSHEKIRITPGETVAVIGQGAAGLLQTRLSVISGAEPVFAITRSQWKLDIAKKYGATIINAGEVDPVEAVKEATDGQGVDLAIESVGSSATLRQAMEMVRLGGTVLFFGIAPAAMDNFNGYAMYYKEIKLIGSKGMVPKDFHTGIKLAASGKMDLHDLITHRFDLDHVKNALDLVNQRSGDALRVVVNI